MDAEVKFLFTLANPGSSLLLNTHWSTPPVSTFARSGGPRKMSQSISLLGCKDPSQSPYVMHPISRKSGRRLDCHRTEHVLVFEHDFYS